MQDVLNAEERIKLLKEKLSHETPLPCEVKNFGGLTAVVYKETTEMEELKGYFRMGSLLADEIKDAMYTIAKNRMEQETGIVAEEAPYLISEENYKYCSITQLLLHSSKAHRQMEQQNEAKSFADALNDDYLRGHIRDCNRKNENELARAVAVYAEPVMDEQKDFLKDASPVVRATAIQKMSREPRLSAYYKFSEKCLEMAEHDPSNLVKKELVLAYMNLAEHIRDNMGRYFFDTTSVAENYHKMLTHLSQDDCPEVSEIATEQLKFMEEYYKSEQKKEQPEQDQKAEKKERKHFFGRKQGQER